MHQSELDPIFKVALKMNSQLRCEVRYAHKKNQRKKSYGGSKLIYENNFTIKKPRKNGIFQISMF